MSTLATAAAAAETTAAAAAAAGVGLLGVVLFALFLPRFFLPRRRGRGKRCSLRKKRGGERRLGAPRVTTSCSPITERLEPGGRANAPERPTRRRPSRSTVPAVVIWRSRSTSEPNASLSRPRASERELERLRDDRELLDAERERLLDE